MRSTKISFLCDFAPRSAWWCRVVVPALSGQPNESEGGLSALFPAPLHVGFPAAMSAIFRSLFLGKSLLPFPLPKKKKSTHEFDNKRRRWWRKRKKKRKKKKQRINACSCDECHRAMWTLMPVPYCIYNDLNCARCPLFDASIHTHLVKCFSLDFGMMSEYIYFFDKLYSLHL